MKEFMEEYGGVIVTCMLAELFFDGIGIKMSGGQM